jgi:hypothetical protein
LSYWKNKLEGVTALQLPTDFARPAVQSTRGAIEVLHVGKDLNSNLKHLSQQHGATLFMTLMAAFKVLLHRYTGPGRYLHRRWNCRQSPTGSRTTDRIFCKYACVP